MQTIIFIDAGALTFLTNYTIWWPGSSVFFEIIALAIPLAVFDERL